MILKPLNPMAPIGEEKYSLTLPSGARFTMLKPGIAFGAEENPCAPILPERRDAEV